MYIGMEINCTSPLGKYQYLPHKTIIKEYSLIQKYPQYYHFLVINLL